ncbi:MAG: ABC transporter permease subunit [Gaiellales bacterium]|jgi:ABC-2 type transport system permease protein
MSGVVLRKTLRDLRWALVWWSLGVFAVVLLMAALWPSVRDVYTTELLQAYPEELQEVFNFGDAMDGATYLNIELHSMILPVLFGVFAIGRGARLIAGEEQDGTLEPVVASPVPRWSILLQKGIGLAVALVALGIVLGVATLVGSAVGDLGIPARQAFVGALAMVLLGLYAGATALAVGAGTGRRGVAIASAGLILVGGYLLHVIGAILPAVEPWRAASPFTQAIDAGPVGDVVPWGFALLAGTAVALVAASVGVFARRDLRTP